MVYTTPPALTADRSLKRESIVMVIHPEELQNRAPPALPEGYAFRMYRTGDIAHWSRITTIVEEFDTQEAAEAFFAQHFLPQAAELEKRCVFVTAPDGAPVATATAWMFEEGDMRFGRVHWICNDPAHQGQGIGHTIVLWTLNRLKELEPGKDVYLDTQTWSHKAIGLYLRLGFHPVRKSHPVLRHINDYDAAVDVLREVMPETVMEMFINRTEA